MVTECRKDPKNGQKPDTKNPTFATKGDNHMLKIGLVHIRASCGKHPKYSPEDGEAAIVGNCRRCQQLLSIWRTHQQLTAQLRNLRKVKHDGAPRTPKQAIEDARQIRLF